MYSKQTNLYEAFVNAHCTLNHEKSGAEKQTAANTAWKAAKDGGRCEEELALLKAKVKLRKSKQTGFFANFAKNSLERAARKRTEREEKEKSETEPAIEVEVNTEQTNEQKMARGAAQTKVAKEQKQVEVRIGCFGPR